MSELRDITEICPQEMSKLLGLIPKGSAGVTIQKKFSKDLSTADSPIASHPRYQTSTFIDVRVHPS